MQALESNLQQGHFRHIELLAYLWLILSEKSAVSLRFQNLHLFVLSASFVVSSLRGINLAKVSPQNFAFSAGLCRESQIRPGLTGSGGCLPFVA